MNPIKVKPAIAHCVGVDMLFVPQKEYACPSCLTKVESQDTICKNCDTILTIDEMVELKPFEPKPVTTAIDRLVRIDVIGISLAIIVYAICSMWVR